MENEYDISKVYGIHSTVCDENYDLQNLAAVLSVVQKLS